MLKLTGLLLLFSSAVLTGFYAATTLEEREKAVGIQLSFWRQFAMQLSYLQGAPAQLVAMLAGQSEYKQDRFVMALRDMLIQDPSFGRGLTKALNRCPELQKSGVAQVLLPLGDVVGLRDLESQLAAINAAISRLGELRQQALVKCKQMGGLYRRLGILGGLLLAVIFF